MPANPAKVPVWASNRGVQMMVRVALAQERLEPHPVPGIEDLRRAAEELRPRAVIAAADDLRASGQDAAAVVRAATGLPVIVLGTPRPGEAGSGATFLPLPFTSRDLLAALGSQRPGAVPPGAPASGFRPATPSASAPAPVAPALPDAGVLADLVREEVRRLVEETARRVVEEAARRLVPELAESLIKQELARLLKEVEDAALADRPPED